MSESVELSVPTRANPIARAAAFIGGLAMLGLSLVMSVGIVLASLAGIALVAWLMRRRQRVLGRGGWWGAAVGGAAVVLLGAAGTTSALMPRSLWQTMKHAADSAAAQPQAPPPAWVERLAPGTTQRAAAAGKQSSAMTTGMLIWVGFASVAMMSAWAGSLGWVVAMLFGYAVKGRWPGAQPPTPRVPAFA